MCYLVLLYSPSVHFTVYTMAIYGCCFNETYSNHIITTTTPISCNGILVGLLSCYIKDSRTDRFINFTWDKSTKMYPRDIILLSAVLSGLAINSMGKK